MQSILLYIYYKRQTIWNARQRIFSSLSTLPFSIISLSFEHDFAFGIFTAWKCWRQTIRFFIFSFEVYLLESFVALWIFFWMGQCLAVECGMFIIILFVLIFYRSWEMKGNHLRLNVWWRMKKKTKNWMKKNFIWWTSVIDRYSFVCKYVSNYCEWSSLKRKTFCMNENFGLCWLWNELRKMSDQQDEIRLRTFKVAHFWDENHDKQIVQRIELQKKIIIPNCVSISSFPWILIFSWNNFWLHVHVQRSILL